MLEVFGGDTAGHDNWRVIPIANMVAKYGDGKYQCSCCDRSGKVRRAGKKGAKAKEARAWKKDQGIA